MSSNKKKIKLDKNFLDAVKLLNIMRYEYWISNGTLLGIIRNKELIDWDNDVDFCLWNNNSDKTKIIKLFTNIGFKLIYYNNKFDFLSFYRNGGRVVDINFYHKDFYKNITFSIWPISTGKLINKITLYLLFPKKKNNFFLSLIVKFFSIFFNHSYFVKKGSYFIPLNYLRYFKYVDYNGVMLRIPVRHNDILRHLYGYSWKIPKKKFNWVKDSPSTRTT